MRKLASALAFVSALVIFSCLLLNGVRKSEIDNVLMMGPLTRQYFYNVRHAEVAGMHRQRGQMLSSVDSPVFGFPNSPETDTQIKSTRLPQDRPDRSLAHVQARSHLPVEKAEIQSLVQDVSGMNGDISAAAHWDSNRLPQDRPENRKAWAKAAALTAAPFREVLKDCQAAGSCGSLLGHRISRVLRAASRSGGRIRDMDDDRLQQEKRMERDYEHAARRSGADETDADVSAQRWRKLQRLLNSRTPTRSTSPVQQQAWQLGAGYQAEADLISGPARPHYTREMARDAQRLQAMPSPEQKMAAVDKKAAKHKPSALMREQLAVLLRRAAAAVAAGRVPDAQAVGQAAAAELSSYDVVEQPKQQLQQQQHPHQSPLQQRQAATPRTYGLYAARRPAAARRPTAARRSAAAQKQSALGDFAVAKGKPQLARTHDEDAFDREVTCWQTGRGCDYLIKHGSA